MREQLVAKLRPDRFTAMSGKMAAIVGYILDERFSEPAISELVVTSDGFVLAQAEGEVRRERDAGHRGGSQPQPARPDRSRGADRRGDPRVRPAPAQAHSALPDADELRLATEPYAAGTRAATWPDSPIRVAGTSNVRRS